MSDPRDTSRFSGAWAYALLVGCGVALGALGRWWDGAYLLFIEVARFGPVVLFGFLFVRHLVGRARFSWHQLIPRLAGCIAAMVATSWTAWRASAAYNGMDDAPRGLVWDLHLIAAPALGLAMVLVARLVGTVVSRALRSEPRPPGASDADQR